MNQRIRLLGDQLPRSEYGDDYLWFDSLSGTEYLNQLYSYQLIIKTKNADGNPAHSIPGLDGYTPQSQSDAGASPANNLNVQPLIGTQMGLQISLAGTRIGLLDKALNSLSGDHHIHGLISRIKQLSVHNRHAVYAFTLVPWLWLLTKQSTYRLFSHKSVVQIAEDIFAHYPYPIEWRLSNNYLALDYQVQYGESDFTFLSRLLQEHGINYHFEHDSDKHTLVLSDQNNHFKILANPAYQSLTVYPPHQRFPEYSEYIEHFEFEEQLTTGKVLLADYQFKTPSLTQSAEASYHWQHAHNELLTYEWQQGDYADSSVGQPKADLLSEQQYQHGLRAYGKGRLKAMQVGHHFNVDNHPNSDSNRDWLILGLQTTITPVDDNNTHQFFVADTQFIVQPVDQTLRPDRTIDKPVARSQTAMVVGPEGATGTGSKDAGSAEEIHTDEYGRVKVKFHWDRPSLAQRGLVFAEESSQTCWLRVSTAWAGNNFGTVHIPRVGQEVIVDFFGGDPDMPYVSGRLTNPDHMPNWVLPKEKVLSGIKSKEYQGSQSNQLVMDDSTGELQVHLKSDHEHSELNLGHITRIPDASGRADFRGAGFELRSDGHGVIRADKGLVLTSFGKTEANSYVKDITETTSLLQQSTEQHKIQTQLSINQLCEDKTLDQTVVTELETQVKQIKGEPFSASDKAYDSGLSAEDRQHAKQANKSGQFTELSKPQLILSSPSGIGITAKESMHLSSNEHVVLTSEQDTSVVAGSRLSVSTNTGIRVFSQSEGIKLFAGKDDVELQVQDGKLIETARDDVEVTSTEGSINLTSPKEICLRAGGSEIKINSAGVFITTPGIFKVHAATHDLVEPESVNIPVKFLPKPNMAESSYHYLRYIVHDQDDNPLASTKCMLIKPDGSTEMHTTDSKGKLKLIVDDEPNEYELHVIVHEEVDGETTNL